VAFRTMLMKPMGSRIYLVGRGRLKTNSGNVEVCLNEEGLLEIHIWRGDGNMGYKSTARNKKKESSKGWASQGG